MRPSNLHFQYKGVSGSHYSYCHDGATRKKLAERLQLGRRGLDHKKKDVEEVVTRVVLELGSEPAAPEALPSWATPQDEEQRLEIFLVTFSSTLAKLEANANTEMPLLRDPSDVSKDDIQKAMLDVVENPSLAHYQKGGRPRKHGLCKPLVLVTGEEPHESRPEKTHKHTVVKFSSISCFLSFKIALRERHGLASHWYYSYV